jgi:hypothetical protein
MTAGHQHAISIREMEEVLRIENNPARLPLAMAKAVYQRVQRLYMSLLSLLDCACPGLLHRAITISGLFDTVWF